MIQGFVKGRCPHCTGNVHVIDIYTQGTSLRIRAVECLMCNRELRPTQLLNSHGKPAYEAKPVLAPTKDAAVWERMLAR